MKINHVIKRAIQAPQPGKCYGARVEGMSLNKTSVTIEWAIFSRKIRKAKRKIKAVAK